MPKQTFFNLTEEKRRTLIEAAEKEFARAPVFEASIANIIKTAGIPRGSFYQYFEDKEDFYFYLLDKKLKESKASFISLLKKHNGDVIEAVKEKYEDFLIKLPDEEERGFLKNALLHTSYKVENSFFNMFEATGNKEHDQEIIEIIDKQRLNIKNESEVHHIFQIIAALAFHNFIEKTLKELSDEEAMRLFTINMNLIKNGIYR